LSSLDVFGVREPDSKPGGVEEKRASGKWQQTGKVVEGDIALVVNDEQLFDIVLVGESVDGEVDELVWRDTELPLVLDEVVATGEVVVCEVVGVEGSLVGGEEARQGLVFETKLDTLSAELVEVDVEELEGEVAALFTDDCAF